MILIDGGKKEESQLYIKARAWLDAANKARETRDPIDGARVNTAGEDLMATMQYIKSGHVRVRKEDTGLILTMDVLFNLSPMAALAFRAHKPTAKRLFVLARLLEDDIRVLLAELSGSEVPPRSTAMDEMEDKALADVPTLLVTDMRN